MKARNISGVFVVLLATSAAAEWTLFDTTKDDAGRPMKVYVDHSTIKKSDERGKVWTYFDFPKPVSRAGKTFRSIRNLNEFDCKEDRHRIVSFTAFSQLQLKGVAVADASGPTNWDPIPPDTLIGDLGKLVCNSSAPGSLKQ
jgi:hypothetical protein